MILLLGESAARKINHSLTHLLTYLLTSQSAVNAQIAIFQMTIFNRFIDHKIWDIHAQKRLKNYLFIHFLGQAFPCRDIKVWTWVKIREILKRTANPMYNLLVVLIIGRAGSEANNRTTWFDLAHVDIILYIIMSATDVGWAPPGGVKTIKMRFHGRALFVVRW